MQGEDGKLRTNLNDDEVEMIRSTRGQQSRRRPITEADIDRINADLDRMEGEERKE